MKPSKISISRRSEGRIRVIHLPFSQSESLDLRSMDHLQVSSQNPVNATSIIGGLGRVTGFLILLGLLVAGTVASGMFLVGVGH